jgi:polysaccharide chain length determinant protein (PEP-CTERM system associated)
MAEEFEEQTPAPLDLGKYRDLLWRRRWYVVVPLFVVWILSWGVSWMMPSVYRSSTLILVEQPTVSQKIVGESPASDLQSRLDSIEQQIRSRTRLLSIIQRFDLYAKQRAHHVSDDDLVARMNKDLSIVPVRSPGKDDLTSFSITFDADNPVAAQEVTKNLSDTVIGEDLQIGQQNAANTVKFLDSQLEDARQKLADQDEKVRIFKDRYMGELPTQAASNLQILSGYQNQLQAEEDALGVAKQRAVYLESLQDQYKTVGVVTAKPGEIAPSGLAAIDQELSKEKDDLKDLLSRYTEQHPDVRKKREQIAQTEKLRAQRLAESKTKAGAAGGGEVPVGDYGDGRTATAMMDAASQLKANETEVANRQRSILDLKAKIGEYEARLNSAPAREQQLNDLMRDYDQSKKYYDETLDRKNHAEMSANLGKSQEGLQFRPIDPPSLPTKPYAPKRFLFSLGGLIGGLALGIGLALGAEFMDHRIYDQSEFKKLVQVEMIAEIPPLPTPSEQRESRGRLIVELAAGGAISVVMLLGVAISFLRG